MVGGGGQLDVDAAVPATLGEVLVGDVAVVLGGADDARGQVVGLAGSGGSWCSGSDRRRRACRRAAPRRCAPRCARSARAGRCPRGGRAVRPWQAWAPLSHMRPRFDRQQSLASARHDSQRLTARTARRRRGAGAAAQPLRRRDDAADERLQELRRRARRSGPRPPPRRPRSTAPPPATRSGRTPTTSRATRSSRSRSGSSVSCSRRARLAPRSTLRAVPAATPAGWSRSATRSPASTSRRRCSSCARVNVPEASFAVADLRELPFDDAELPAAVCGLALAHLPSLDVAVGELARVLAPGGRLIVSVLHPFQALLGWNAPFSGADGSRGFVREHPHLHADYLAAFADRRSAVRRLLSSRRSPSSELGAKRRAFRHIPEATAPPTWGCRRCSSGSPRSRLLSGSASSTGSADGRRAVAEREGRSQRGRAPARRTPRRARAAPPAGGRRAHGLTERRHLRQPDGVIDRVGLTRAAAAERHDRDADGAHVDRADDAGLERLDRTDDRGLWQVARCGASSRFGGTAERSDHRREHLGGRCRSRARARPRRGPRCRSLCEAAQHEQLGAQRERHLDQPRVARAPDRSAPRSIRAPRPRCRRCGPAPGSCRSAARSCSRPLPRATSTIACASSRVSSSDGQERARAGLDVHHQRVEPGGELLGEDRGDDQRQRLDRAGRVADRVQPLVGGRERAGLADDRAADAADDLRGSVPASA